MSQLHVDRYFPASKNKDFTIMSDINNGSTYIAVLNQADVVQNCNKSFLLQLIHRKSEIYIVYTRSGRVGQTGTLNTDIFIDKDQAIECFKNIFKDKTGILWDERYSDADLVDGKYRYVKMKHEDQVEDNDENEFILDRNIQDFIKLIYDPTLYNSTNHYNIDTEKLPLGSLSISQINKAFDILKGISECIEDKEKNIEKIAKLSSMFYTLIPSIQSKIKPIDDQDTINDKMSLLELLQNMYHMSKNIGKGIAQQYLNLNADLKYVTDQEVIQNINKYLSCNRGGSHGIQLKLDGVYSVNKPKEKQEFLKWNNMHNKQLLWHGTRLANAVGILTQGLCINPSGVYTTGKMFGNGIYFANSSTKSANYMGITRGLGIMFLCEVALGNTYEKTAADYITTLPPGKHSTHGIGMYQPNVTPDQYTKIDGVNAPIGNLVRSSNSSSLNYDEFIVYDKSQVKIKYVVLIRV